jgi:hypothetical protein|tara:strand:- start:810 stop:953 length:144 start_codon:yes stop_codon:yes gene_type:complete
MTHIGAIPTKVLEDDDEHNQSNHSFRNPNRFEMKPRTKYDVKILEEK